MIVAMTVPAEEDLELGGSGFDGIGLCFVTSYPIYAPMTITKGAIYSSKPFRIRLPIPQRTTKAIIPETQPPFPVANINIPIIPSIYTPFKKISTPIILYKNATNTQINPPTIPPNTVLKNNRLFLRNIDFLENQSRKAIHKIIEQAI
ncbi:MAG: hypothetical protein FWC26_11365 [Fibromonadales bacterium]|nr:hypothetical protein [Fibromonadales bacterium]